MSLNLIQYYLTENPCYKANVEVADSRYLNFQTNGPKGGMLHSVGCAQPDAKVFLKGWNKSTYTNSCVHGVIDANDGTAYQCLPWNYRGWHAGTGTKGSSYSANNSMIGVEMCESKYIKYLTTSDPNYSPGKFIILDKSKAQADCKRAYNTAVELFAMLAVSYNWNVSTNICSHKEGYSRGIATGHGDPEHYWKGLGMSYTMDGFRADVTKKINSAVGTLYRIRKVWEDPKTQAGAYRNLEYAKANCPVGYHVFDEQGKSVYYNSGNTDDDGYIKLTEEELDALIDERADARIKAYFDSLKDNDSGKWSKEAREWAINSGLIAGVGKLPDGSVNYAWESPVTREQLVQFLYRFKDILVVK